MKVLVTGARGFVGRNLVAELRNEGYSEIREVHRGTDPSLLDQYTSDCDFVFHLAGCNRPNNPEEYLEGNFQFTSTILDLLMKNNNKATVLFSSSIQVERENLYGKSKKAAEELVFRYRELTGARVFIYRLPNLFGKWSRPNYNSVVSTYCHNISRGLAIRIDNPQAELMLSYIDDVLDEFKRALKGNPTQQDGYCIVPDVYKTNLGDLASLIQSFARDRETLSLPNLEDNFTKKLYSTYLSFLPMDELSYDLDMHVDHRGHFTEFIKTIDRGQVSINVSKPGVTKGNHWHHTKHEKFLVVSGVAIISFRNIGANEVIRYKVSEKKLQVVDIPPGYAHSITNVGETDLVTVMWANELFTPERPDTYYEEV